MSHPYSGREELAARVAGLIAKLEKDAKERGWTFHFQPAQEVLPKFLGGFRPSAIAIGRDGGFVAEIRTNKFGQGESLARIADLVEAQRGWDFRVFFLAEPLEVNFDLEVPTTRELASGILEARNLLEGGHERAALVIAWSLLEAIARLVTPQDEKSKARPLSPVQAVQMLAEMGYLEEVDARRLRELTSLRNAVVHGGLKTIVPANDVAQLIKDLDEITHSLDEAA